MTSADEARFAGDPAEPFGDREPQKPAAPGPGNPADADAPEADKPADADAPRAGAPEAGDAEHRGEWATDSPTDLLRDLAQAQQALVERTADLQRLQAEYVNYKRRVDRDRELVRENAAYAALSAMLPVLDDIDRAGEHGELSGGFKAVADSLERIVAGLGLVKFGKAGDEFDPRMHEAVMHAHSPDVTTTTCGAVVQAGYRIGNRVVRPARVTVVDPEPQTDPEPPTETSETDDSTE